MLNKYGWRQPVLRMAQPGVEPLDLEIRCKITKKQRNGCTFRSVAFICYQIMHLNVVS